MNPAPDEYRLRLDRNRAEEAAATARANRYSQLRLACFVLIVVLLVLIAGWDWTPHAFWLPLGAFVYLVTLHARASSAQLRATRAIRLYEAGLARLDGSWPGRGTPGDAWRPEHHLYADDLDLFGKGSLFELLCVARSRVGERRLADWLLAPADPAVARSRQGAVRELATRLDFREEIALVEGEVSKAVEHGAASTWGSAPPQLTSLIPPQAHLVSGLVSATLLVGWLAAGWNPVWMLAAMAVQLALATPVRPRVQAVLEAADRPARDLDLMGRLLDRIEAASFESEHLAALKARLTIAGLPPSARIRRLTKLTDYAEARLNQIFLPISWLFSIGTQLAFAIERWRAENGDLLREWIDVLAEIEALASLAGYAYERADHTLPEILDEGARFEGTGLHHPLLPPGKAVANDVTLDVADGATQAFVVSGSNMSGKSTLLRTVGVNTLLAFAGAPVPATTLRIAPLSIGASIRVNDSLQEGASRFYAEIERLKAVVDASETKAPALFLLDEILHGTNSHDRRIGAEAVVRTLLENGAIGLVTTHDLALAEIAEQSAGRLRNVHFEDHMEDGRMAFDYQLKDGVVTHSNALALMRAVGLDVGDD